MRGAALHVLMWKDPRNTFSEEREVLTACVVCYCCCEHGDESSNVLLRENTTAL